MKKSFHYLLLGGALMGAVACNNQAQKPIEVAQQETSAENDTTFQWEVDRFEDIRILRYRIPNFDRLTTKQKAFVYYLTQAGLAGRDIMWDQNYKHNIEIRTLLEKIYTEYKGDKNAEGWKNFETYLKQIWMSNGIHHHYSNLKHQPKFDKTYFESLL
ncbi:MAG: dipeptidyl-peptidase, partial [Bacteroidota bacterium]